MRDRISLFIEADASYKEFEVNRDDSKGVVLKYEEMHAATGIDFKLNEFIRTSLSVGGAFNRSLKYRDSVGKVNIKDGFYSEFRLVAEF